jgi:hypothetical protein
MSSLNAFFIGNLYDRFKYQPSVKSKKNLDYPVLVNDLATD